MISIIPQFRTIAQHHANIWFEDDKRDYDKLEDHALNLSLYVNGEESDKVSERVAKNIRESYEICGNLDDGDYDRVMDILRNEYGTVGVSPDIDFNAFLDRIYYGFVQDKFSETYCILKERHPLSQAYYHTKWWRLFYHKEMNKIKRNGTGVLVIFHQHNLKLGFPRSIAETYYLVRAGMGHNKRDIDESINFLEKYWRGMWDERRDRFRGFMF